MLANINCCRHRHQQQRGLNSDEPTVSGELSHLEDELQAHRDSTSAHLDSMEVSLQTKLQESLNSSLANFQSSLLAELKLFGVFTCKEQQIQPPPELAGTAITQPDGSVRFGSIPPPLVVQQRVVSSSNDGASASSATLARSNGSFLILFLLKILLLILG
ncbi:hypothetical protein ACLB2K_062193 [Fragaria x ananassa]